MFKGILGHAVSARSGAPLYCRGRHPGTNAPIVALVSFPCGAYLHLCTVVLHSAVDSLTKEAWLYEASVFTIAHANALSRAALRSCYSR